MMVPHVGASNESLAGAASMFFLSMVVGDSTRVGDVCQLLNVLWESPPTRTLYTRSDNDSFRNGKNRFYDAKSCDSTNQSDIGMESVRDRVTDGLYKCSSFDGNESIKGVGRIRYRHVEFANAKDSTWGYICKLS
jgi:hypothetical protein